MPCRRAAGSIDSRREAAGTCHVPAPCSCISHTPSKTLLLFLSLPYPRQPPTMRSEGTEASPPCASPDYDERRPNNPQTKHATLEAHALYFLPCTWPCGRPHLILSCALDLHGTRQCESASGTRQDGEPSPLAYAYEKHCSGPAICWPTFGIAHVRRCPMRLVMT